jgi:uncharacterized protein YfaS (alpha-2-macroglobulin family)
MSKISQYLLIAIASISVALLGYQAYVMATDTFSLPFAGQEHQTSSTLHIIVAKPWIQIGSPSSIDWIDRDALITSITKNGKPWNPTVSGEWELTITGSFIDISSKNWNKGDTIRVSSAIYNREKKSGWKLPRDFASSYSDEVKNFEINSIGLPRDMDYEVKLTGYKELTADDIRWYRIPMHYTPGFDECYIRSLEPSKWQEIKAQRRSGDPEKKAIYHLDINTYPEGSCIVAGIAGDLYSLRFEHLGEFSVTGSLTHALSPEYDMRSRIEFDFSTDIFADTGVIYSDAYIEHRRQEKIEFLKKLSISGGIEIGEEDIELSPRKAIILANMTEWEEYHIDLDTITDIYGRQSKSGFTVTPVSTPSLSIYTKGNKTIVRAGDPIPMVLYFMKPEKPSYDTMLCRVSLEGYARVERMNEIGKEEHINSLYDLLRSRETKWCIHKNITLPTVWYRMEFDLQSFQTGGVTPGLYILAFANQADIAGYDRWIAPRTLSIIDTHITMKTDSSGKMQFLTTDIRTGEPRWGQDVVIKKNISQLYTQTWDSSKQENNITYLPLSTLSWGTGDLLGKTNTDGTLAKYKKDIDGSSPYGLTSEWGDYEGRYDSFVAITEGGGHFGYIVSTWNDGITGWNFGLKESDYGWDNRSLYSAYTHTERRLYLPGDTVYIKSILRKNESTLTLPAGEMFDVIITDPLAKTIHTIPVRSNAWGSIATSIVLPKDAPLGSYNINIQKQWKTDENNWISGGYTTFQVEIFSNPTFTASVSLSSPQVSKDILTGVREVKNNDPNNPWYEKAYKSEFSIDGIVKAHYYNGATIRSVPFSYRVYKSPHYDMTYWWDCFWGCYSEPSPEFYTEWTGSIDADGYGAIRIGVEFASFSDDYLYTVEVTIRDPLTGETVTTPGTLLVSLPQEYKMYDAYNPLTATITKRMIQPSEDITATIAPKYGKWDPSLAGKYQYSLIHRSYTSEVVSTLRSSQAPMIRHTDTTVASGVLIWSTLDIPTRDYTPGEYTLKIEPITTGDINPPETAISESLIYIMGNFVSRDSQLRVIPEHTIYRDGDTAHVLITTPFSSGGHLYITRERGGVIDHEYINFTGSTYSRDYTIDESFYPNVYIGVVAFPKNGTSTRAYAVWYGEIIMDLSEKKWNLQIKTNKNTYKNRETVTGEISLTDHAGKWQSGEIEIMVIDESLIRLMGNIDLDIIPKFWQKYGFTMKTALTAIGMERNKFISRKGSNGWSGDKWGDGTQISSRTLFKNTAYYNASIITDANGKAKFSFVLPDNVTDYRIIAVGHTRSSEFSVSENTIQVRRDYTLESHAPSLLYPSDQSTITASVFNATARITPVSVELLIGTGGSLYRKTETMILGANQWGAKDFRIEVWKVWNGDIPYTITVREWKNILDSITKNLHINTPPVLPDIRRISGSTQWNITLDIPAIPPNTRSDSVVTLSISDTPLQNPERTIKSLLSYPYGCIEQTISSTLPNAVALSLAKSLTIQIDEKQARENLATGVAKILGMQDENGWWKYWESDRNTNSYVTPYVIRSLYEFRRLWVQIPDDVFVRGMDFIINHGNIVRNDWDNQAEIFATLAQGKHAKAWEFWKSIDTTKLSRHGYLMYAFGLSHMNQLDTNTRSNLQSQMNSRNSSSYWYWDDTADQAIYARLLIRIWERDKAARLIQDILQWVDMESYFISTQSKIQLFMGLIELSPRDGGIPDVDIVSGTLSISYKADVWSHRKVYETKRSLLGRTMDIKPTGSGMLYYEISFRDTPIDIAKVVPVSHPDLQVTRVFERVDESKWLDTQGQFISAQPVSDGIFEKGVLYRVRLTAKTNPNTTHRYYLTLEDYIPGGWRPISSVFHTESSSTTDTNSQYGYWNGWTHVESQRDRIFATQDYLWWYDKPYTYTYYIRPEHSGTYLLPPVTAYYMYQPQVHATGKYEKVVVK